MPGRYGRWLSETDFHRRRQEETAALRNTRPTRPALICEKCREELEMRVGPWSSLRWELVWDGSKYIRQHKDCGGLVTWQEVTWAKEVGR